jgi:predicted dehydrogenase
MKVGILGSGFMGRTHARAYTKMKGVEVAAVASRHLDKAQKLANEVGGRATTDNMAIINDPSIDAISNTLPTHLPRRVYSRRAEGREACARGEAVCAHGCRL